MRGISSLAANQLASQKGLCTVEWVSKPFKAQLLLYCCNWINVKFIVLHGVFRSRRCLVGIATMLRAGRSGVRILVGVRDLCLLQNAQPGFGTHPTPCSMDTLFLPGCKSGESDSHIHLLMPRVKISGPVPLIPLCIFMAWEEETVSFTWCSYVFHVIFTINIFVMRTVCFLWCRDNFYIKLSYFLNFNGLM